MTIILFLMTFNSKQTGAFSGSLLTLKMRYIKYQHTHTHAHHTK